MRGKFIILSLLPILVMAAGCNPNNFNSPATAPQASILGLGGGGGLSVGVTVAATVGVGVNSIVPTLVVTIVPPLFPTNTPTKTPTPVPTRTFTPTWTPSPTFSPTSTFTFLPSATPTATSIVPDANLRQAVMETLETATPNATVTLNAASLAGLTTLVADNNSVQGRIYKGWVSIGGAITSLQGLQNCTHLQTLYLESNAITDLTPLAPLAQSGNLSFLDLDYNDQLADLSPLSGISSLTGLELRSGAAEGDQYYAGALSDLGPVSNLTNMDLLEFSAQPVNSITPLAPLGKLTRLYMIGLNNGNGPANGGMGALKSLGQLRVLYAQGNKISDISSLATLSQLQLVDLANNSITDISPLAGLSNATTVVLSYNRLSGAIPSLGNLGNTDTALDLVVSNNADPTGNTISDISNLDNVPGLKDFGSVLDITSENGIPQSQISQLQSADPNLTIVGP